MKEISLTPLEVLTLLALARLGGDAYAVPIREDIRRFAGRAASVATIYGALDRLHQLGLTRPHLADPRPERGGRARRHYALTAPGRDRLRRERERALALWADVAVDAGGKR